MPFGPEISWPNGFRQIDPEARFLLESGYGRSQYDHVDPGYGAGSHATGGYGTSGYGSGGYGTGGYGTGSAGGGSGSAYLQPGPPSADDYGYGDPGYSDPAYDGPGRGSGTGGYGSGSGGPGSGGPSSGGPGYGGAAGYRAPDYRESSRPEPGYQSGFGTGMYPVTGAQEALPATGPQPVADWGSRRDSGYQQGGYPEQWYDHPRMVDPRSGAPRDSDPRASDPRASDPRASDPRASDPRVGDPRGFDPRGALDSRGALDPRLEGMRYDDLRYDDSAPDGPRYDEPRYDEPLDESWVAELRRSAPVYPQHPGGDQRRGDSRGSDPRGSDSRGSDPRGSDPRGGDVRGPGRGQQTGSGPQAGYSQAGYSQASGFGQAPGGPGGSRGRDDRGGAGPITSRGPRMSAAPETGPASRTAAYPREVALQGEGYLASSTQVGVLPPPATRRLENPVDSGPLPAIAAGSNTLASPVRPGHGLDGPEITSSWPAQPSSEEVEAFEEFWSEDDDADYPGLFPDRRSGRPRRPRTEAGGRRTGRRRGRSSDKRLWMALIGVVVVAGGAIFGILKFESPSHSGPTHELVTPAQIDSYMRKVGLEKQTDINKLRQQVIQMSHGQAHNVVDAVYESGDSAAGGNEQIVMFIGGNLANADPATSITSFTQAFAGAKVVSPGSLGGRAACGTSKSAAMCVWFDNDSFGEFYSPTMNANSLAGVMRALRPSMELVVKK